MTKIQQDKVTKRKKKEQCKEKLQNYKTTKRQNNKKTKRAKKRDTNTYKKSKTRKRILYCNVRAILHSCNVLYVPLIFCNSVSVWKSGLTRLTIACCIHMCLLVQVSQSHTTSQATNPGEAKWLHWLASCVGIIIVMSLVYSPRPWVTSAHNSVTLHTEGESFCQNTSHRLICFASSSNETYLGIPILGVVILEYN